MKGRIVARDSDRDQVAGRHRRQRAGVRSVLGLAFAVLLFVAGGVLFAVWASEPAEVDPRPPVVARGAVPPPLAPVAEGELMEPNTLALGGIGVAAPIVDASVINGVLTPPSLVSMVGIWLDGAALDAAEGTTLLAGHVNLVGQGNGALFNLALMKPGDLVHTSDAQGRMTAWRVTAVVDRPKADGIEESVLDGPVGPRRLAVVTCGGDLTYANGVGNYEDNVYLYAELAD